jgi:hypothetical protein
MHVCVRELTNAPVLTGTAHAQGPAKVWWEWPEAISACSAWSRSLLKALRQRSYKTDTASSDSTSGKCAYLASTARAEREAVAAARDTVRRLQGRCGGRIRLQGRARLARGRGAAPPRWGLAPVPPLAAMENLFYF